MANVKERIYQFIEYKGISVYSFEVSIGKTKSYLRNSKSMSSDTLSKICEVYPDLNPDWVLTGNGNIVREIVVPVPSSDASYVDDGICKRRLIEFINHLGMTAEMFEESCNMASGTIRNMKIGLSSVNLRKVCVRYKQLNVYWLIGVGGEDMLKSESSLDGISKKLDDIASKIQGA